jgi:AcrR family transcriptional regulator
MAEGMVNTTAVTTRKQRDRAARKELILRKSKELFLARGFDAVTIQDICHAVEYGRSVFYSHFESKEEVFHHIKLEGINHLAEQFQVVDPEAENLGNELQKCANILFDFYSNCRLFYEAMFLLPVPTIPVALQERIAHAEQKAAARPLLLLQRGLDSGAIRCAQPPTELVFLYWTALAGIINFHIQHHDESDKERVRAHCLNYSAIFVSGISARGSSTLS